MDIEIRNLDNGEKPHVTIYTDEITEQIQEIINLCSKRKYTILAEEDEKTILLKASDVYMMQTEGTKAVIHTRSDTYISKERLCNIEKELPSNFFRISKYTIVNLDYLKFVEPSFNGNMLLVMKNGSKDYISRKYLSEFKKRMDI